MKNITIILLFPITAYSQEKVLIVKDTTISVLVAKKGFLHSEIHEPARYLVLSNGKMITANNKLELGKGSLPNGDYNWIATPSNTMEAKLKGSTTLKKITIKEIKKKGNEKYGYKYVILCEGNYILQIENAIATGEIIL